MAINKYTWLQFVPDHVLLHITFTLSWAPVYLQHNYNWSSVIYSTFTRSDEIQLSSFEVQTRRNSLFYAPI